MILLLCLAVGVVVFVVVYVIVFLLVFRWSYDRERRKLK